MDRAQKQHLVTEMHEKLGRATAAVLTDFRGMTVGEMTDLRDALAAEKVEYRVMKNTLMRRAAEGTLVSVFSPLLKETCAVAIGYHDPTVPARVLKKFTKTNQKLKVKAGALGNRLLGVEDVIALADLPTRDELLGRLLGTMNAVPTSVVRVLAGVPRAFVGALAAIQRKKEEEEGQAAA